jgi:hypothetical protein
MTLKREKTILDFFRKKSFGFSLEKGLGVERYAFWYLENAMTISLKTFGVMTFIMMTLSKTNYS